MTEQNYRLDTLALHAGQHPDPQQHLALRVAQMKPVAIVPARIARFDVIHGRDDLMDEQVVPLGEHFAFLLRALLGLSGGDPAGAIAISVSR